MKVRKHQLGGLLSTYKPILDVPTPPNATGDNSSGVSGSGTSSSSGSTKGLFLEEDLIKELIGKGLPNEVNQWALELEKLTSEGNGVLDPSNRRAMYRQVAKANKLVHNKKLMDTAVKDAQTNNGLQEYAITDNGGMFVLDKTGQVKTIDLGEYKENSEEYQALTNGQLADRRRYDPKLIDRADITEAIGNSIGTNKINDQISTIVEKLGSYSEAHNVIFDKGAQLGETKKAMAEIEAQIKNITGNPNAKGPSKKQLQAILGEYQKTMDTTGSLIGEGMMDVTTKHKSVKDSKAALSYILSVLPNNSRHVLETKAVMMGGDKQDAYELVHNAIQLGTDTQDVTETKYKAYPSGTSGSGSGGSKLRNYTQFEAMIDGTTAKPTQLNIKGGSYAIEVKGVETPGLVDEKNKPLGPQSLAKVLSTGVGRLVDQRSMSIGGNVIRDPNSVVYDGKTSKRLMLPTTVDQDSGAFVPDYEKLTEYEKATSKIKKGMKDQEVNDILSDAGLDYLYSVQGKIKSKPGYESMYKPFLVVGGFVSEDENFVNNQDYLVDMNSEDENQWMQYFTQGEGTNQESTFKDGLGYTDMLEGNIFMLLDDNSNQIAANLVKGGGSLINPTSYNQEIVNKQARESRLKSQTTSTSDLLQLK